MTRQKKKATHFGIFPLPSFPNHFKMVGCVRLFLLSLGISMLIFDVISVEVYEIGRGPYQDISSMLEDYKTQKLQHEESLSRTYDRYQKAFIEGNIRNLMRRISHLESSFGVAYKDYLEIMATEKKNFEHEKENLKNNFERVQNNLQKELEKAKRMHREAVDLMGAMQQKNELMAKQKETLVLEKTKLQDQFKREKENLQKEVKRTEHMHRQALDRIGALQQKNKEEIGIYEEKLNALTKEADRTAREYAEYTEKQLEQEEIVSTKYNKQIEEKEAVVQKLQKEKDQLMQMTETLAQKLEETQNRHSWALEAMAVTSKSDQRSVSIPYQDKINEIRHNIGVFAYKGKHDALMSITKENLEALLQQLYQEGGLSDSMPPTELEKLIDDVEMSTVQLRKEQDEQRRKFQEEMEDTEHADFNEEELASLKKANEAVDALNEFLQDLARRKAYLKAITQVNELLEEVRYLQPETPGTSEKTDQ